MNAHQSKQLDVVLCADRQFLPVMELVVASLLDRHSDLLVVTHLFVPEGENDPDSLARIKQRLELAGGELCAYAVSMEPLAGVGLSTLPPVSLIRILVPDLINEDVGRYVYLDGDLVVIDRLDDLLRLDLKGMSFAAVLEWSLASKRSRQNVDLIKYFNELGISLIPLAYFNSGVMVVDVARWKKSKSTERLLEWLKNCPRSLRYVDQEAMSICLADEWLELHPRFNCAQNAWDLFSHPNELLEELQDRKKDIREAWLNPAVIHYVGNKPWQNDYYALEGFSHYALTWWREARRIGLKSVHVHSRLEIVDWLIRCACGSSAFTRWLYWGLRRRILVLKNACTP